MPWDAQPLIRTTAASRARMSTGRKSTDKTERTSARSMTSSSTRPRAASRLGSWVGGFLGLGHSHYPIPWGALTYDRSVGGFRTNITEQQLRDAPEFSDDSWEDRDWAARTHSHYGDRGTGRRGPASSFLKARSPGLERERTDRPTASSPACGGGRPPKPAGRRRGGRGSTRASSDVPPPNPPQRKGVHARLRRAMRGEGVDRPHGAAAAHPRCRPNHSRITSNRITR